MKKRLFSILTTLLLTFSVLFSTACGNVQLLTENSTYVSAPDHGKVDYYSLTFDYLGGKDVMPLGTFFGPYTPTTDGMVNGVSHGDYVTDYYFDLLQKSGINMINCAANQWTEHKSSIQKAFELCKKYQIGYFVQDYSFRESGFENISTSIREYIDEECVLGNLWRDEPKMELFDEAEQAYANYAQATDKTLYVNLWPIYSQDLVGSDNAEAVEKYGSVVEWEEYLREFMKISNSNCLSFDHYPFEKANTGSKGMERYYTALSTAREVANDFKVPFWCYIQCGDIWDYSPYRPSTAEIYPNEGEWMWNANTCLAYGAKSLTYHTFIQPPFMSVTDTGRAYDFMGMLGANGQKNRWYYYAEKQNVQIKAIDHILMNSAHMGVIGLGEDLQENITGEELIKSNTFRELKGVKASKDNVLIGCFDYNGKTALYVVNCETENKQTVTLKFDQKYGYEVIQRGTSVKVTGKQMKLTLERGEGVMISLI